jgi:hypothetical protein
MLGWSGAQPLPGAALAAAVDVVALAAHRGDDDVVDLPVGAGHRQQPGASGGHDGDQLPHRRRHGVRRPTAGHAAA